MAEQTRNKPRGKQPLSRHPLFPATVALWFAAPFALVSLAFAPALAANTYIFLALVMAAIGGLLGLGVARRIAGPKAYGDQTSDGGPMPSADTDGSGALWSELKGRRRSLLAEPGSSPADDRSDDRHVAPPIERDPQILDLASVDAEPLDPAPVGERDQASSHDASQAASNENSAPSVEAEEAQAPPAPVADDHLPEDRLPVPAAETSAERIAGANPAELSQVELLERLALSLQRRSHAAVRAREGSGSDAPLLEAVAAPVAEEGEDTAEPEAQTDAGYSSLLNLGSSVVPPLVNVEAAVRQDDYVSEPAVVFPGQAERRNKLRRAFPVAPGISEVSSLPAPRPFDAPGSAAATPQDAEETERALRAALAALQRMSGAA